MSITTFCCAWRPVLPLNYDRNAKVCCWLKTMIHRTGNHCCTESHSCQTLRRQPLVLFSRSAAAMEQRGCVKFFIALALFLDIVGLILFFVGIFAPLSFWDFFVLSGPLLIFFSLIPWIFWYTGQLTVSEEELNLIKQDIL